MSTTNAGTGYMVWINSTSEWHLLLCVYCLVLQLLRLYFAEASGLIKGDIFGLRYV